MYEGKEIINKPIKFELLKKEMETEFSTIKE